MEDGGRVGVRRQRAVVQRHVRVAPEGWSKRRAAGPDRRERQRHRVGAAGEESVGDRRDTRRICVPTQVTWSDTAPIILYTPYREGVAQGGQKRKRKKNSLLPESDGQADGKRRDEGDEQAHDKAYAVPAPSPGEPFMVVPRQRCRGKRLLVVVALLGARLGRLGADVCRRESLVEVPRGLSGKGGVGDGSISVHGPRSPARLEGQVGVMVTGRRILVLLDHRQRLDVHQRPPAARSHGRRAARSRARGPIRGALS